VLGDGSGMEEGDEAGDCRAASSCLQLVVVVAMLLVLRLL